MFISVWILIRTEICGIQQTFSIKVSSLAKSLATTTKEALQKSDAEQLQQESISAYEAENNPIEHIRVILAEDSPFNRKLIKLMLAKVSIESEIVANGEELINRLKEKSFDMIIIDVNMPKMDGLEATQMIRSGLVGEANRKTYIAAFTAAARREDADRCYKAGMDGFLRKPFKPDDLYRQLIRSATKKQPLQWQYDQTSSSTLI